MNTIYYLSGDYPEIGKEEVIALEKLEKKDYYYRNRKLTVKKKVNNKLFSRYAYVKKIYQNNKLIFENKEPFTKRRPHLRPVLHPSSLQPKLARAMVNLTGIKTGAVCDPFCGTGGILIEAGLMGLKPVGYDIEEKMIIGSKLNLKNYRITNFKLKVSDATKVKLNGAIVADLPYAKNTKTIDLEKTFNDFLINIKNNKNNYNTVLGFPDFVDYKKIIRNNKLKIKKEFSYYIHKSMSKKIVVLE